MFRKVCLLAIVLVLIQRPFCQGQEDEFVFDKGNGSKEYLQVGVTPISRKYAAKPKQRGVLVRLKLKCKTAGLLKKSPAVSLLIV